MDYSNTGTMTNSAVLTVAELTRCIRGVIEAEDLFRDLRASGAMSARAGDIGLRTPRWRARLLQRYESLRREHRLPATFEIIYGHAWKPQRDTQRHRPNVAGDGRAVIRFDRS